MTDIDTAHLHKLSDPKDYLAALGKIYDGKTDSGDDVVSAIILAEHDIISENDYEIIVAEAFDRPHDLGQLEPTSKAKVSGLSLIRQWISGHEDMTNRYKGLIGSDDTEESLRFVVGMKRRDQFAHHAGYIIIKTSELEFFGREDQTSAILDIRNAVIEEVTPYLEAVDMSLEDAERLRDTYSEVTDSEVFRDAENIILEKVFDLASKIAGYSGKNAETIDQILERAFRSKVRNSIFYEMIMNYMYPQSIGTENRRIAYESMLLDVSQFSYFPPFDSDSILGIIQERIDQNNFIIIDPNTPPNNTTS